MQASITWFADEGRYELAQAAMMNNSTYITTMENEESTTSEPSEKRILPAPPTDASDDILDLDLSKVTRKGLCLQCRRLRIENFNDNLGEYPKPYVHRTPVLSLRESARQG